MARFAQSDIILELIELCHDLMNDITQQLNYYRASVYKTETAGHIKRTIEQLRTATDLIGHELVLEPFRDHDAVVANGIMSYIPGECSLTFRTTKLLNSLDEHLRLLHNRIITRTIELQSNTQLTKNIQKRRRELLAMCRHGSRQWEFFHTL